MLTQSLSVMVRITVSHNHSQSNQNHCTGNRIIDPQHVPNWDCVIINLGEAISQHIASTLVQQQYGKGLRGRFINGQSAWMP